MKTWGWVAIVLGLVCWLIGDGHSLGINPPIPEAAKVAITLLGWTYLIDGVRVLRGHRPFMRRYSVYALSVVAGLAALCFLVWLVLWIYDALSLKALVAIGLIVAVALLVFILKELRRTRTQF